MTNDRAPLIIPDRLKPRDGRFGSGPSRVPVEALEALAAPGSVMGTSHRQAPVKSLVARLQENLAALYRLPDGYQVVLGNGGSNVFWDIAVCCLIEHRSAHGAWGEFGRKFVDAVAAAPFLGEPVSYAAPFGQAATMVSADGVDVYAWPQNETSTGVCAPVQRVGGAHDGALMLIDATSSAGGMDADISQTDAYYFAPQKNFASDGGLWAAFCSPAALERSARLTAQRWVPPMLNLTVAAENSALHQTLNTPALATLALFDHQLTWLLENGGMAFAEARTQASSGALYAWAEAKPFVRPFVADPAQRSPVVATLQFDESVDAKALTSVMRANGIVDIEPYRSAGPNQIRVGCYAAVDPSDVDALIECLDWTIEHL
ncbi:MAG: phosphoserine transaminase [Propionibacteriaceae bacterium]|nr:phosphoserine transaminase [Propionibacteriaceae bacterium]